ncbi:hypothetical protein N657DRAFT_648917 [Parathielavia appendiculata]|uniref:Uncharacterized protein n=1 Tax=Parathielavia appendiculata TaxID=2587402 RepID=A0AAN6TU15_9PEZI|nr:hypothetical protein N657DRAFT_648917 [Parathielavia appendiculata]
MVWAVLPSRDFLAGIVVGAPLLFGYWLEIFLACIVKIERVLKDDSQRESCFKSENARYHFAPIIEPE